MACAIAHEHNSLNSPHTIIFTQMTADERKRLVRHYRNLNCGSLEANVLLIEIDAIDFPTLPYHILHTSPRK